MNYWTGLRLQADTELPAFPTNVQSPIPLFAQYSSHPSAVIFPELNSAITRTGSNFSASRSK
jgi:hypothetical protein